MKFSLSREDLLKPLQLVMGAVEKRQTLPVLGNVLLDVQNDQLSLTATDLEVELVGRVALKDSAGIPGKITVPARKLMDICRSLPEGAPINIALSDDKKKVSVRSRKSRFSLITLPASEFPNIDDSPGDLEFNIKKDLRKVIEQSHFAMATQDVRYYLNGMLFEMTSDSLVSVTTDGHRLAYSHVLAEVNAEEKLQVIIPRKGIVELLRLLDNEEDITVAVGANHLRIVASDFTFTSKLIDGKFPEYQRVIPKDGDKPILLNREEFKQVLQRVSILSNEKLRGVHITLRTGVMHVSANNPDQEEAEEEIEIAYKGQEMGIGFNVGYVLDVLNAIEKDQVKLTFKDGNSSILIEEVPSHSFSALYVIMPLRL